MDLDPFPFWSQVKLGPYKKFCPKVVVVGRGGLMHLGVKAKIDHLVLDVKLLLINMNYVKKFLFLEIL